jgi:hypothetical protein
MGGAEGEEQSTAPLEAHDRIANKLSTLVGFFFFPVWVLNAAS